MPDFTYAGEQGREYPSLSAVGAAHPEPGKTYSLPHDPHDPRWQKKAAAKKAPPAVKPAAVKANAPKPDPIPDDDPAPVAETKE